MKVRPPAAGSKPRCEARHTAAGVVCLFPVQATHSLPNWTAPQQQAAHPRASRTTRALRPVISATAEGPPSLLGR